VADAVDTTARERIAALEVRMSRLEDVAGETRDGVGKLLMLHTYEVEPTKKRSQANSEAISDLRPRVDLTEKSVREIVERSSQQMHADGEKTRARMEFIAKILVALFSGGGVLYLVLEHYLTNG